MSLKDVLGQSKMSIIIILEFLSLILSHLTEVYYP